MRRIYLQPGRAGAGGAGVQDDTAEVKKGREKREGKKKKKSEEGRVLAAGRFNLSAVIVYWLMEI